MRRKFLLGVVIVLLGLAIPGALPAQVTTTTLFGRVTDSTGAAIARALVTATNKDTNLTRTEQTNTEGEYRMELLPVGNYSLEVSTTGFKRLVRTGIVLELNVPTRVDVAMELGEFAQTVTVTGAAPQINTSSAEIGRSIENDEIANLPLVNRNVYQLLELTPGVQNSSFSPGQPNPVITLGYPEQRTFINGGVDGGAGSVSYYLDGGINMTGLRNTGNILPNPDAIQEYRVETNNYDAEYGKMSSGVISVVTKSGSNSFHGSLFDYWRDDVLNAEPWNSTVGNPPLRRNQFGGTFGGPIKKDKTFFFVTYQGLRQLSSFVFSGATLPTAAEAGGNLAALFPVSKSTSLPTQYTCGSPTQICPSMLDPTVQRLLNATAFPNIPTAGTTAFEAAAPSPYNTDEFIIKLDHNLTRTQRLSGSYFYTSGNNSVPPLNSVTGNPNGNIPWDVQQFTWRQQNLNLSDTWTVNPNLVNQAWFSYTRNFGGRLNLPGTSLGDLGSEFTIEGPHSLPQLTVGGPVAFTAASAIAGPEAGSNFYSVRDVVSYTHGRHTFSFGAEEVLDKDVQQTLLNNYGVFGFNNTTITDAISGVKDTVPGLALFLMGLPTSITQDSPVTGYTNTWSTGLFAQDNFRVFPRLTLNLGLRWDIETPPTDPLNRGTSFQVGQQSVAIPQAPEGALFFGDPGITRGIVPVRWHHVSPRFGLAWDPFGDGKTSVRAAAGVFYGSVSGNEWNTYTNFEPSAIRFTFTNTNQNVVGLPTMTTPAVPLGATFTCPYNNLTPKFVFGIVGTVTCPATAGSGAGITGNDPFPFTPPNFLTVGGPFFGFAKNFQWPYTYQLNFSVQRQVTSNFSVSVAYVGNLNHDLPFAQDLNAVATGALAPTCATSAGGNIVERRPIDNTGVLTCAAPGSPFGTVLVVQSNQTASYNGLQTTAQLRATRGVTLYAFYTYSHTFDSVQLDNNTTQGGAEDMTNLRLERGPADFDLRHQFVTSVVWQLNYYHGDSSWERGFLNGWALSTIVNVHSGFPVTIYNGSDANLSGNVTAGTSAPTSGERAELVPGENPVLSNRTAQEWFNTAAFKQNVSTSGISINGDSGRNLLRGPTFKDVDLSISRDFGLSRLKEGMALQFRADAYNVFNIVSLSTPSGNSITAGSSTFGEILTANPMRQLQLGVRLSF